MAHIEAEVRSTGVSAKVPRAMRFGFWICTVIGVAIVIRRAVALSHSASSGASPELAKLDAWFLSHVTLTYVHIFTGLVFIILLPLVFWYRTQRSIFVRGMYYGVGAILALTAYAMSVFSVGGWVERAAVLFFNTFFFIALCASFQAWRRGMLAIERRWTLRSAAVALGIATTRPVMGVFFAISRLTHWTPRQFFGPAFWIGFAVNVVLMELWLRKAGRHTERGSL